MTRSVFKKYLIFTGVEKYAFFAGIDKVPIYRKCIPRKIPKKYRVFAGFDKYLPHLSTCLQRTVTVFASVEQEKYPPCVEKVQYLHGTLFFCKLLQIKYASLVDEVPIIRPCLQIKVPIR